MVAKKLEISMSKLEEGKFQKALISKLYSQGAWTFNVHGHSMQKTGVADVLIVHRRWTGFVELKAEKNPASAKQKDVDKDLQRRFFPSFVLRCVRTCLDRPGYGWDWSHRITIENFQGGVLCKPAGLDKVLDCLQALNQQTRDWEKIPKQVAEGMRSCREGDVIWYAGKRFLCEGKI